MHTVTLLLNILQNIGQYKQALTIAFAALVALNAQFHFIPEATMNSLIAIAIALGIWAANDGPKKIEAQIKALDEKWSNE